MKNVLAATLLILSVSLISCGSEPETKEQQVVLPATTNTAPVLTPIKNETTNTNTNTTTLPIINNNSAGALNPEHGKPGHRCDIAVGAPLNSAPANKTAAPVLNPTAPNTVDIKPTATATPITATPANAAPVTAVAPGMNPQHGQPGHRCDIAVGAPLNSPPNKAVTPPVTSTPVAAAPITTNIPVTATAPGMNPQHGQPGHRCDIAVGAPLNSKPKQ